MLPFVYVETTVVSYLTARPSRDVIIAGHQQSTHFWWDTERSRFELCCSQLVEQEASDGDSEFARARLAVLSLMTKLEITETALSLAEELVRVGALPAKARNDALHIAIAAVNQVPYLLTWNCRHMANAQIRVRIESVCAGRGFNSPILCTPEEMMEVER